MEIGTELSLQIEEMKEKFRAVVIGMDAANYITARLKTRTDILTLLIIRINLKTKGGM
jgi:hypothetical protein